MEGDRVFFRQMLRIMKYPLTEDEKVERLTEGYRLLKREEYGRLYRALSGLFSIFTRR